MTEKEIHSFHLQKAFAYVGSKAQANWAPFRISDNENNLNPLLS